jgi:hypothetical protein
MPPLVPALLLAAGLAGAEASTTALFIGDSHTDGGFGSAAWDELKGNFGRMALFGICSARAKHYLAAGKNAVWLTCGSEFRDSGGSSGKPPKEFRETTVVQLKEDSEECKKRREKKPKDDCKIHKAKVPYLPDLLNFYGPSHVIVALGSNGLESQEVSDTLIKIHETGTKTCFWIGPPYMRSTSKSTVDGWYSNLALNKVSTDADAKCTLIDSRTLSVTYEVNKKVKTETLKYPSEGGDGTHFWDPIASAWGKAAAQAIQTALGWTP